MARRALKTDNNSYLALSRVREGTILVADDGFTCIANHAQRRVFRDRGKLDIYVETGKGDCHGELRLTNAPRNSRERLYVRCKDGRHYLSGQVCEPGEHDVPFVHYIGFWLKGKEPPK